ncbi:chemotaxis protein CheW [Aquabacterium sp. A7-Y]|uniref:chemotaxis protein CheW n=1 Tax=Aquabacterium sp. A7-Y TaxID=1349605 RepID=UPI00223C9310|nr:chemotaxis protein CheW [Aquabacterium sp. A7-Y]MCW7541093.1 chemotaxis protein CheW [Aquabacterium sp. A7-Y]
MSTSDKPAAREDAAAEAGNRQFVTFSVADEMFAVPMGPVQEIIRVPEVARLPLAPAALDGLANLRGRVLPIMNLRRLFGCPERPQDDATRAVVINLGQPLGFVVDRVASVVNVDPSEIESASSIQTIVSADYLRGVIKRPQPGGGTEMLLIVDFEQLVDGQFAALGSSRSGGIDANDGAGAAHLQAAEAERTSDELRLVSFSVAEQEYALDIAEVQEIVQMPERLSVLPNTAHHVVGVMSLRQRLLPLVSLRALFGLPTAGDDTLQRILVTTLPGGAHVGLVTDAVKEVMSVPRSQTEPMPGVLAADQQLQEFSSICRLDEGRRLVSIVDTGALLRLPGMHDALQAVGAANDDDAPTASPDMQTTDTTRDSGDDDTQVVIFRLGAEEFGVPIMSVQEIVRVPETLTRVPKTPDFVEGVINLRGTVLPVIDQRSRLGMSSIPRNEGQRIMVYLLGGMRTGFIVDSVAEVLRIPRGHIAPAPRLSDEQSRLIGRVANLDGGKRLVMLIEPEHLLQGGEAGLVSRLLGNQSAALPLAA